MGWIFHSRFDSPQTHAEEKAEVLRIFEPNEVLQISKVNSTWYLAVKTQDNQVLAAVVLTQRYDGEWGYKDMDETMGPREAKAPMSLIKKLSPIDSEYALNWRENCRLYASRAKPKPGDKVRLAQPLSFDGVERDGHNITIDTQRSDSCG